MPKGPNGQSRPADVIGPAVMVGRIATGEIDERMPSGRRESGLAGAKARTEKLSSDRRSEVVRQAANVRWAG